MPKRFAPLVLLLLTLSISATAQQAIVQRPVARIPIPADVLGFTPGDDRKLASWAKTVEYFQKLDAASDRVRFEELGKTTLGAPFVMATISAPENLARLNHFRKTQELLADPRQIDDLHGKNARERIAKSLIGGGKTIVLITCGIHSDEVGSSLSSMLIAHRLASSNEPEIQNILKNTIILLVPSLNPDGVDIVKKWYDQTLGTPYEGAPVPMLYNKYVGHDNNRDWYAFSQIETQTAVDKIHNVWHPQIVHDIHQQGELGSRLFLPPYMPPVEPNVPKQIVEGYTELGHAMAADLRAAGLKGITTDTTYDAWTPARAYSHYHGGVRILSETASCKIATPITVKFAELNSREGYDPKKASANFGPVWEGGEWRLRDITNYMTAAAFSLLKHAAQDRERWLQRFYEIGKEAVRPRKAGELFGFLIPEAENRDSVFWILNRGQVFAELPRAGTSFIANGRKFPEETLLVRMDQPYGAFAKALLEVQHYPDLRDAEGHPIAPYDVTAHTLPLLMDVEAKPVSAPFRYAVNRGKRGTQIIAGGSNGCEEPPLLPNEKQRAVYVSFGPSMDSGWTRWVLDSVGSRHGLLFDKDIRAGNIFAGTNVIIIPDQSRGARDRGDAFLDGRRPGTVPDDYAGGLGKEGVKALREFVEEGGTLVCLNRASEFAIEQFKLPVRNVVAGLPRTDFYVPGSILRIELDTTNPIANGMPKESIAWVENSPVFEIKSDPLALARVKIIAWYPKDKDPLRSGWLLGGDRIKGKAALVEVGMGKGRIILFGFRPQYRGQSLATYPLLFNAIRGK